METKGEMNLLLHQNLCFQLTDQSALTFFFNLDFQELIDLALLVNMAGVCLLVNRL